MQKALISLFEQVHVQSIMGEPNMQTEASALNAEAALEGFTFAPDILEALSRLDKKDFDKFRFDILGVLRDLSGSLMNHAALYNKFPYDTPEDRTYLTKRIVEAFRNDIDRPHNNFVLLSCGHFICDDLFPDLTEFSACPLCQRQVRELSSEENVLYEFKAVSAHKLLRLADRNDISAHMSRLISRPSSLSPDERSFVNAAVKFGFLSDVPAEVFRETLPLAFAASGEDIEKIRHLVKGASDVLRLATWMSDDSADLSLSSNVQFKVSKARRRKLLTLLETMPNLGEDVLLHREKWKCLAFSLHVGSSETRRRYPRVAEVFEKLRSDPKSLPSFSRSAEQLARAKKILGPDGMARHLKTRPGEFIRRLDYMYRNVDGDFVALTKELEDVVGEVALPALFALRKYLPSRVERSDARVFTPKGGSNKMKIIEDLRNPLRRAAVDQAVLVIDEEIRRRLSALPSLGKTFVEPSLYEQVVPFNRRGDSSTAVPVTKGQRYPLSNAPVIRLFVHWTGQDVDLSTVIYDENFNVLERVYYGDLAHNGWNVIHSGDVTDAPEGASEFIDFDPAHIAAKGGRYLMGHLISFRGGPFKGFPCFAGFMERDALKSGKKYEPEAVALKFDIKSGSTTHMPLIFDVVKREVIFADIASGSLSYLNVEGKQGDLQIVARAVVDLPKLKPTLGDVAIAHALARGIPVTTREEADTVFDWESLSSIDVMSVEEMAKFGS